MVIMLPQWIIIHTCVYNTNVKIITYNVYLYGHKYHKELLNKLKEVLLGNRTGKRAMILSFYSKSPLEIFSFYAQ